MNPNLGVDLTDLAERAGAIASRNGNATVAPMARSKVRRDNAFFVTNIIQFTLPLSLAEEVPNAGFVFAPPCASLIWNGVLFTTPKTRDANVLLLEAASRTIPRTAGASKY